MGSLNVIRRLIVLNRRGLDLLGRCLLILLLGRRRLMIYVLRRCLVLITGLSLIGSGCVSSSLCTCLRRVSVSRFLVVHIEFRTASLAVTVPGNVVQTTVPTV